MTKKKKMKMKKKIRVKRGFTTDATLLQIFKGYVNKEAQVYSPGKHCRGRKL